ncbi:MAG TPA: flagellar basal body P-ring formation protein FlgA [Firmicutes bacterium]|jgi:flagella basal body P-ring formation protein FlgA|nr:flagellar basal body P-ring formation protein FlgA [Bacillota bacterium]
MNGPGLPVEKGSGSAATKASSLNRTLTLVVSVLCLAAFFLPGRGLQAGGNGVKIIIPAQVEVRGEEILLWDIARIQGKKSQDLSNLARISLGRAPRSGQARWLYRSYVEYVLERSGWPEHVYDLEMPAKTKVLGASQEVSAAQFLTAVEDFFREKADEAWTEFRVEPVRIPDRISVSPGEIRLTVAEDKEVYAPGPLTLRVIVALNGKEVRTVPVTVRLHIKAHVLVAKRPLGKFETIFSEDLTTELREVRPGEEVARLPEPGKYRVTRALRQGEVVKRKDLQLVPEVVKGSKVGLTVNSGSLRLSLVGLAVEDGWLGDTIRVKNIDSNQIIMAKVTGAGQVEVSVK